MESTINNCAACGALLRPGAKFCSQCGQACGPGQDPPAAKKARWYHNIWFVLFMLFFVLQVFGLPLVWKNPNFSRSAKITLTAITILWTLVLVIVTLGALQTILHSLLNQNSELKSLLSY